MKSSITQLVPECRNYDGCQSADAQFDVDEPGTMVLVQQWESRSHHEKYLQWRVDSGVMAELESMLVHSPSIRNFEQADA